MLPTHQGSIAAIPKMSSKALLFRLLAITDSCQGFYPVDAAYPLCQYDLRHLPLTN